MPTYRKLHTKIIDSYDFAEMPNDFTRVFWMLLIVTVDSEGRAIDNPAWLRSKMFPLRTDVSNKDIESTMTWLHERKMIIRYEVDGRNFFYIPKFKDYQSGTEREARSVLPAPPAEISHDSRPTHELVKSNANTTVSVNESVSVNLPSSLNCEPFLSAWEEWKTYRSQSKHKMTAITEKKQLKMLEGYSPSVAAAILTQSITHGWQGLFPPKNGNGNSNGRPSSFAEEY